MSSGQKGPDFAYPRDVLAQADSIIKASNKQSGLEAGAQRLYAISLIAKASSEIDPDSIFTLPARIQAIADAETNAPSRAMMLLYEATTVQNIYEAQEWKYDRVEIPLEPRPADMSAWSGAQFKARVKELVMEAAEIVSKEGNAQIEPYKDSLEGDSQSLYITPNVGMMVCIKGGELLQSIGDEDGYEAILNKGFEYAAEGSTAFFALKCALVSGQRSDIEAELSSLYSEYSQLEAARFVLLKLAKTWTRSEIEIEDGLENEAVGGENESKIKFLEKIALLEMSLSDFPTWYDNDELRSLLDELRRPKISVSTPSYCEPKSKVNIKVTQDFTSKAEIVVRKLPVNTRLRTNSQLKNAPIIKRIELKPTGQKDFNVQDSVIFEADEMALYIFTPEIDGKKEEPKLYTSRELRAVTWVPLAISSITQPVIAVVNAETGAPEKGVSVRESGRNNKYSRNLGLTDNKGVVRPTFAGQRKLNGISLHRGTTTLDFEDFYVYAMRRTETGKRECRANIYFSRALYHPGDTIEWAAVVYEKSPGEDAHISKGLKLKATLRDANYQECSSVELITDETGRISGSFPTPKDGLTGNFSLSISCENGNNAGYESVMVSDFKLPTFEVKVDNVERDVPASGDVTIGGEAMTYTGMPVGNASVQINVKAENIWWWFGRSMEQLGAVDCTTDDSGRFTAVIPASMLEKGKDYFRITADACVTARGGESQTATRYFSLGKPYAINVELKKSTVDGCKPLTFSIQGMTANPGEESPAFDVVWKLSQGKTVLAQGRSHAGESVTTDISKLHAGRYTLKAVPVDSSLSESSQEKSLTIYNTQTGAMPKDEPLFVPNSENMLNTKGEGEILIGVRDDDTSIYVAESQGGELKNVRMLQLGRGFHKIAVSGSTDNNINSRACVFTVKNCILTEHYVDLKLPPAPKARLRGESLRDKTKPGIPEQWTLKFDMSDGRTLQGGAIATMYNKALSTLRQLSWHGFSRQRADAGLSVNSIRYNTNYATVYGQHGTFKSNPAMPFRFLYLPEYFGGHMIMRNMSLKMSATSMSADMAVVESVEEEAACEDEAENGAIAGGGAATPEEAPAIDYRVAEVLQGFWMPELKTAADGTVELKFTMPNAVGAWTMDAFAWNEHLESALVRHELVSAKPVMVQPTLPRFVRQGDKVVLTATLYNNSDEELALCGGFDIRDGEGKAVAYLRSEARTVAAGGSEVISLEVEAPTSSATLTYKIWAEGAGFTDGEQGMIPVLDSQSTVIESECFYLNPTQTEPYTFESENLPGFTYTLQYCQNPVWSLVKALRGNTSDVNTAPEIVSVLFSNLAAIKIVSDNPGIAAVIDEWKKNPEEKALNSMLEKNEQLKALVLGETPWVSMAESESARMAALADFLDKDKATKQARKLFEKLYALEIDGGICWADWADEPSYWPTETVLTTLGIAQSMGLTAGFEDDVKGLVKDGLKWLDKSEYIKNQKGNPDLMYAYVHSLFPAYGPMPSTQAGKSVCENTLNMLTKKKAQLSTVDKGYAILTLKGFGRKNEAAEMARSLEQFGVMSADMGMSFPSVHDIRGYATLIQALSESGIAREKLDAMRQWVILQTQATDDLGAWNPDYVIAAVMLTGSVWTDARVDNAVTLNGESLKPGKQESASGYFSLQLPETEGTTLRLSVNPNGETPSYGSLTRTGKRAADKIAPREGKDVRVVKRMLVKRNGEWADAAECGIEVGETVRTDLEIKVGRDMEYVTIKDERPAGMEPLNQLPGAMCGSGLCYYQENRDASTRIFAGYIAKGTYHISYEQRAWTAGDVISGICTVQSQLAPELTAHSGGCRLKIRKSEPAVE
ncbi:MAG: hypothetical protein K2L96_08805 [Muribaculaceae bacterium]|nr:hypothetical protein [Muribaculaceae bacterium]